MLRELLVNAIRLRYSAPHAPYPKTRGRSMQSAFLREFPLCSAIPRRSDVAPFSVADKPLKNTGRRETYFHLPCGERSRKEFQAGLIQGFLKHLL